MTRIPYKVKPRMGIPAPYLSMEVANLRSSKTESFDMLIDTGTKDSIILMLRDYKRMGFQTSEVATGNKQLTTGTGDFVPSFLDKAKIIVKDLCEGEMEIRGAPVDIHIVGIEWINQIVLLLHGPLKFFRISC